jgi:hypothetical protein
MAASNIISTFASEFSKFGNFMFDHVRKTMAEDPDAELPDVDEMVRLYLQPDEPIKIKKPRAKPAPKKAAEIDAEVTQVPAKPGAKPRCTATTGKGTRCSRKCSSCDDVFCSVHLKTKTEDKKTSKTSKKKKTPPKHTHPIQEVPESGSCDLCESHGNPLEDDEVTQLEVRGSDAGSFILEEDEFVEED